MEGSNGRMCNQPQSNHCQNNSEIHYKIPKVFFLWKQSAVFPRVVLCIPMYYTYAIYVYIYIIITLGTHV